ncbi:MAG: TerC/Alx family metal homeostasis membrane protein [Carbonactinosporaceae bacterium]
MEVSPLVWAVTLIGLTAVIVLDLVIVGRRPHAVGIKEAALWVLFYVGLALIFGAGVFYAAGPSRGGEFVAGYITEYSLSVDNLFVFVLILTRFSVPAMHQHRVLLIGIVLSLVLRGLCIAAGAAAISAFDWVFYIFGAILIYTAVKLALDGDSEDDDFQDGRLIRTMQRLVPTTENYDGAKMLTRVDGRRMFTPMVVVILAIGVANVIFALDSIPAIFGLTQDTYIVFTANAFALMGLRQLYFLIGGLLDRLVYLSYGLSLILGFIGVKLVIEALHGSGVEEIGPVHLPDIGIGLSLGIIVATLAVTAAASLLKTRLDQRAEPRGEEEREPAVETQP